MHRVYTLLFMLLLVGGWPPLLMAAGLAGVAQQVEVPQPASTDVCRVCGMFVTKYPEWVATVQYKDGHAHHFDGAKDIFKYLLNLSKYAPDHKAEDIQAIAVTEYYGLLKVNARQALYVVGSDVVGPMGHELVPLAGREDAEEFMKDHGGKRILTFDEVDKALLKKLDEGEGE